jgi:hypothetical protein
MLKVPDDAVPQFEAMLLKKRIKLDVQRNDLAIVHMIADLPAK